MKKFLLFVSTVFLSFFFLGGFTTLAESETIDGETYFNDYFNYSWDFYKFDLTDYDIILMDTYTNLYYFRINVRLPDNALIDGINTPFAIYSFNGYKLKYGDIIQTEQRYNIYSVLSGNVIRVNISINRNSIDNYLDENNYDPMDQFDFYTGVAEYINQYFVAYYAKTDTYDTGYDDGYNVGYNDGRDDGYNDGYDVGHNDGFRDGYESGHHDGYFEGKNDGYNEGYDVGYNEGKNDGYDEGYDEGYNDGYNEGYNDFNVADYFGTQNIAKVTGIEYYLVSDPFEPSTSIVVYNAGRAGSNILLDKPYLIVIIKKNIYDYVVIRFDNILIYHFEATYFDIGDYNIYVFDLSDRLNTKYNLEIRKENVTTTEQANEFLNDVVDNIYFSHASKLLTSSLASQFYYFGYIAGLEEIITDSEAYQIGYESGYNNGYIEGNETGYERGFEDGYEQGFEYGKTVEYEQGYNDGYNDGYNEGIKEPFFSNFHVWIVPAIIIVVIAGIFVGYRRERYGGE